MRVKLRGGEWIETRLLSSGPRTNPWFQECGQRIVQNNEIVSWDSDLVGSYGICVDISRSWWIYALNFKNKNTVV